MYKKKTIRINTNNYSNIYATSDIHGNIQVLDKIINNISDDDLLIIIGDLIDKGKNSLDTIRRIMNQNNILHIMGNREYMYSNYYSKNDNNFIFFNKYIQKNENNLYKEMCYEMHIIPRYTFDEYQILYNRYNPIFRYLQNLPIVVYSNNFYFVHAGLLSEDLNNLDIDKCLVMKDFYTYNHKFSKKCVVGHIPVQNLNQDKSNKIIYQEHLNKVFIDGGCETIKNGTAHFIDLKNLM